MAWDRPTQQSPSLQGAVDGGAADAEEVGEFGCAVLAGLEQRDKVSFLPGVELGLLATQSSIGLGDFHPFSGAEPNEVGFELRDHGQHVEQQAADRVVGVTNRPAEIEPDLSCGELVGDRSSIRQRPGQPVQLRHDQGVALAAGRQRFAESRAFPVGAGQTVVDVDPCGIDSQSEQALALDGEVLLFGGAACIADEQRVMARLLTWAGSPRSRRSPATRRSALFISGLLHPDREEPPTCPTLE